MTTSTIFRPACYGICVDDWRILLTALPDTDELTLPGGGVEPGETPEETVVREFREETGLSARITGLLGTDTFARTVDGIDKHSLRLLFAVASADGEMRAEMIDGVSCMPQWVPLRELDAVPHVSLVDAGLRLWESTYPAMQADGRIDHVELWLRNFESDSPAWGWLLTELGYSVDTRWADGVSYRRGPTYIVLETSPDTSDTAHDRLRPGLNHLAFSVHGRDRLDRLYDRATEHGWTQMFAERYPHAGGPDSYAAYLSNEAGFEIELSLT